MTDFGVIESAGALVDYAEASHIKTISNHQGNAGIKSNEGGTSNERVVCKAGVACGVLHNQWSVADNRVVAEGQFTGRTFNPQAALSMTPKSVILLVSQASLSACSSNPEILKEWNS